jgi:hypothetical protein
LWCKGFSQKFSILISLSINGLRFSWKIVQKTVQKNAAGCALSATGGINLRSAGISGNFLPEDYL